MSDVHGSFPPPPPPPPPPDGPSSPCAVEPDAPPPGTFDERPPGTTPPSRSPIPEPPPVDVSSCATVESDAPQKKRRGRWGPIPGKEVEETPALNVEGKKKRKSRWEQPAPGEEGTLMVRPMFPKELTLPGGIRVTLPSHLTGEQHDVDPEVKLLKERLNEINRKLLNNVLDIPPEHERSPSPEPVYDKNGIRQNTRDVRIRERLVKTRNHIIEELIMKDPMYKPPSDYKPQKKFRKIPIPQSNFPGYNFIGLIIGPRGNTQKRMQKETNTKIAIRGKGSVKEGATKDPKYDYGEEEELHVLITGDRQEDVDAAAKMVNGLLKPVDEEQNEHKRLQLRELAALNGTLKDDQTCYLCGDPGHRSYECPKQAMDVYKLPTAIQEKVDELYRKDVLRAHPEEAGEVDTEYKTFLASLGGDVPDNIPSSAVRDAQSLASLASIINAQRAADELTANAPRGRRPGDDLPDDCKLYVGNLPHSVGDAMLRSMFAKYGPLLHATVLMDLVTGTSRGYGFVHYTNTVDAKIAKEEMSGKLIDGRPLVVRLRSEAPGSQRLRSILNNEPDDSKLYVAHLPPDATEGGLRKLFEDYGHVTDVKLIIDKETGMARGYGFVNMRTAEDASKAMAALDGYAVAPGKTLTVRIAGTGSKSSNAAQPPLPPDASTAAQPPLPAGFVPPLPPGSSTAMPVPPMPFNPFAPYPFFPVMPMPNAPGPGVPPPPGVVPEYMPFAMPDFTTSSEAYNAAVNAVSSDAQVPPPPPPLPADQAAAFGVPPPPPAVAPAADPNEGHVMSEYDRFMKEMEGTLP